jgi:FkbM family methyltransferase
MPIQLCLQDFLEPGDCVLDVGANIGGVAVALSRMVGPTGVVHAFEANPETIPRLYTDLAANTASNVVVVEKAAWRQAGRRLRFFCDPSYYASESGLTAVDPEWPSVHVETTTLDDHCRDHKLAPRAIKIDIEGAEYDALLGAQQTLKEHTPVVVLEYRACRRSFATDPLEWLHRRGYTLFDVNLYRRVDRSFYLAFEAIPPLVNVLAIPPSRLAASGYSTLELRQLLSLSFPGGAAAARSVELPHGGRYLVRGAVQGPPERVTTLQVVAGSGEKLAFITAPVERFAEHSCSHLVFEVDDSCQITCSVEAEGDKAVRLEALEVVEIRRQAASTVAA